MISIDLRFIHYLGAKVRLFGDKRLFTSYHNMFKISENNNKIGLATPRFTGSLDLSYYISRTRLFFQRSGQITIYAPHHKAWQVLFGKNLYQEKHHRQSAIFHQLIKRFQHVTVIACLVLAIAPPFCC